MRIRRRPQAQGLSSLQPSDPSIAPQPPPNASRNQEHWLSGVEEEEEEEENKSEELHLHPNVDLADDESSVVRRASVPLLPQDNVVEGSRSLGGAQREGAADGHRSSENGHQNKTEPVIKAGERLVNGVPAMPVATVTVNVKEEIKNDCNGGSGGGVKKRRSPAVLMEGSRCSRMNGRGWRCSQPTLVGYSLCEHHLGKGRMRSVSGGRGSANQLGRTEHRKNTAAVAVVTAAPKAGDPSSVRHC